MSYTLKITQDTHLKTGAVQSSTLEEKDKAAFKSGTTLGLLAFDPKHSDHVKVTLNQTIQGRNTFFVYQRHCQVLNSAGSLVYPNGVNLVTPYYGQLDNTEYPTGSCNLTCCAMVLKYFGAKQRDDAARFPDELLRYADANGLDRHDPLVMKKIIEVYGCKDTFKFDATLEEIKSWLLSGGVCIGHSYLSSSGHIVVISGFNQDGLIIRDPYGKYKDGHYDTYASGNGVVYSYQIIKDKFYSDGQFWVHFVSK